MNLSVWQWFFLALGAFTTGLAKTGISGVGILGVALFANAIPARTSTGALLPLLICADLFGLAFYRKHASWGHLWRLFPWVLPGVIAGYLSLNRINSNQVGRLMGCILLGMTLLHLWRRSRADPTPQPRPHNTLLAALTGFVAGFTTMMANAAGPVMMLYLLATGLPKLVFVGTGAWFFMLVNLFKVPLSAHLGLITSESLRLDALLLMPMIPGALLGPVLLRRINQVRFERMVLVLTLMASLRLML